jgi:hypothetical protein
LLTDSVEKLAVFVPFTGLDLAGQLDLSGG